MKIRKENIIKLFVYSSLIIAAVFVFGCSDSTAPTAGQGQLAMKMVDAPSGFDQVNIVVTKVEVHKAGSDSTSGWVTVNGNSQTYDLLTLRNGANAVLGNTKLDVGQYTQIRLIIGAGSNVVVNGQTFNLNISSGFQTGVKLNHQFEIKDGQVYELTLDFDTDHSIVMTGSGSYELKPVIRVVPDIISGSISGTINPTSELTTISAISGTDTVNTVADTTNGQFKLVALVQGSYDVKIVPSDNTSFRDTTITGVNVTAQQNNDLGTIMLKSK